MIAEGCAMLIISSILLIFRGAEVPVSSSSKQRATVLLDVDEEDSCSISVGRSQYAANGGSYQCYDFAADWAITLALLEVKFKYH